MIEAFEEIDISRGTPDASDVLDSCMALIYKTCHRYKSSAVSFDDLVSECVLAVLNSYVNYDPSKGCSFQSYAMFRIRKAIFHALDTYSRPFSVSWRESSEERRSGVMTYFVTADDGLATVSAASEFEADYTLVKNDDAVFFASLFESVDERERHILRSRYGFDGEAPKSCQAVALQIGISGEHVRKLEERCLMRLRDELSKEYV